MHFLVFNQTACHLTTETNVEQVFSLMGQLSEVNLDPDTIADMVSVMVNDLAYNTSVEDIMDKYYEMFRGNNQMKQRKKIFQQSRQPRPLGLGLGRSWVN